MTVPSTTNRMMYLGNDTAAEYPFTFRIFNASHLLVTQADADGAETTLVLNNDYTVDGVADAAGGSVTLTAGNLPSGYTLAIRRVVPLVQEIDLRNQGSFFAETHEDAFDYLTMALQQLQDGHDRTMTLAETDATGVSTVLPGAEALKFFRWNAAAAALENVALGTAAFYDVEDLPGGGGGGGGGPWGTTDILNSAITYAKIQNVTATDRLLGRSSAGAGVVEEIVCTSVGRALLDDASTSAQRTTLGLGSAAEKTAGTLAGQVLLLSTDNKLPALDASLLTNVQAFAIVSDQKARGTGGGTFSSGAWRTRDLNTEVSDTAGLAAVSSNQVTLAAGTYEVYVRAPSYLVRQNQARLYNVTDSAVVAYGSSACGLEDATTLSFIHAVFTIAAPKVFEVQHRCAWTQGTDGFGGAMTWSSEAGDTEIYTVAIFRKIG